MKSFLNSAFCNRSFPAASQETASQNSGNSSLLVVAKFLASGQPHCPPHWCPAQASSQGQLHGGPVLPPCPPAACCSSADGPAGPALPDPTCPELASVCLSPYKYFIFPLHENEWEIISQQSPTSAEIYSSNPGALRSFPPHCSAHMPYCFNHLITHSDIPQRESVWSQRQRLPNIPSERWRMLELQELFRRKGCSGPPGSAAVQGDGARDETLSRIAAALGKRGQPLRGS